MITNVDNFLPYGRQTIDDLDIQAVIDVLNADYITQGPKVQEFEEALSKYVGAKYAVVCNSGTSALHIACQALGLSKGGNLVTTPITFLATANCAQFVGADTKFVDIDPKTFCMSVNKLEKLLSKEKIEVVVPIHMAGHSADMQDIYNLKIKYGFHIIEDSCHALGGVYRETKVGSCKFSDMSTFSFHPVKHITTAEGGAVTTNDKELYKKLLRFRNHGMYKISEEFVNNKLAYDDKGLPNIWYYEISEVGHNYRITDIQCAIGISQLKKNNSFIESRRNIANIYNDGFKDNPHINTPIEFNNIKHVYHLYTIIVDFDKIGKNRNQVMKELKEEMIGTQVLYIPIHLQPYYAKKYNFKQGDFHLSEKYYDGCLSIPMYPTLTKSEIDYIIDRVNRIIS